jgi:hypothetical protein
MEKERQLMSSIRNTPSNFYKESFVDLDSNDDSDFDFEKEHLHEISEIDKSISELLLNKAPPISSGKASKQEKEIKFDSFQDKQKTNKTKSNLNNLTKSKLEVASSRRSQTPDSCKLSKTIRLERSSRERMSSKERVNCIVPQEQSNAADVKGESKDKMLEYREELRQQIQEKKRLLEDEKRRLMEEDKRSERRLKQQRQRMAAELEAEQRKSEKRKIVMNERQVRAKAYLSKERKKNSLPKEDNKDGGRRTMQRKSIMTNDKSGDESEDYDSQSDKPCDSSYLPNRAPHKDATIGKRHFHLNRVNLHEEL